jgi:P-type Cu+ transporter
VAEDISIDLMRHREPEIKINLEKATLVATTYSVTGMTCSSCVASVERALNTVPGVRASVNFASETVHVLAPEELPTQTIISKIKSAGYGATLLEDSQGPALQNRKSALALFWAILFAIPAISISMVMEWHMWIDMQVHELLDIVGLPHPLYSPTAWVAIGLTTPLILFVAWPIHRAAIRNITHPTMDTLISMGSIAAFTWSIYANSTGDGEVYTEVAAGVLLFVILGRFLESRAKHRASSALTSLLSLSAKEVTVLRNGLEVLIPIEHLVIGDEFVVKPGARIPTDGTVISGNSSVDNSMLTGESAPVDVAPGSSVIGASMNNNGRIIVRATRIGSDTELARITAMVVEAQSTKAPIQRLADRISAVFVPVVTLVAIGTFFLWYYYLDAALNGGDGRSLSTSISVAITVLVIACPCALGLATPVALVVASGRGASRGIVLRKPHVLELAKTVDVAVLDKTGTLTTGVMKVNDVLIPTSAQKALGSQIAGSINERMILSTALTLENANDHPIAKAISSYAISRGATIADLTDFTQTPGSGVGGRIKVGDFSPVVLIGTPEAIAHSSVPFDEQIVAGIEQARFRGESVSVLAWDGVALALFTTSDEVKDDAAETITALINRGITPWLVTGDNKESASHIASLVGIPASNVIAHTLPQEKLKVVEDFKAQGNTVLMIGDGINDAAALAAADLSIAMGTGTDSAIGSADITLMRPGLMGVIGALKLATRTLKTIKVNLGWAFAYNVIGIPIAIAGALTPMYAAAAMAASSLLVVANSLRIR